MISRHKLREEVIKLLYNVEFMNISIIEAKESVDNVSTEALEMTTNILDNLADIDSLIEANLTNYSIGRLNAVDRAIMRLAVYELKSGVAASIVINEALELTKDYTDLGDKKAVKFNNKVLDSIAKSLK